MIAFTVPGDPLGKGRARSTKSGRHYTPARTVSYESLVKHEAALAMRGRPLMVGPVKLQIVARLRPAASAPKTRLLRMLRGDLPFGPTKKPDWDNIGKIIGDALNGVVYGDDSQVTDGVVFKTWGATPGVDVLVVSLAGDVTAEEQATP